MNASEKQLLHTLRTPLDTKDSFTIKVRRFFTDVDGQEIAKGLVPLSLQKDYPVYLFNMFDFDGGNRIAANETPPLDGYFFIRSFIKNTGYDFTQFSGLNNVSNRIDTGDLVYMYADDPYNPNYFVWIVQSISNRSLGSIINTFPTKGFHMQNISMFADNEAAYFKSFGIIKSNPLGVYNFNQITPISFKTVDYQQSGLIVLPLNMCLDMYVGFTTYMTFNTDTLSFEFTFLNVK